MAMTYDEIARFMEGYFRTYSELGQAKETQHALDDYYMEEIFFDEGVPTKREDWYRSCRAHPAVQDKLTIKNLVIDERQQSVVALVRTQAVERATGNILVELQLCCFYGFALNEKGEPRIDRVFIHMEPNPRKQMLVAKAYNIGGNPPDEAP